MGAITVHKALSSNFENVIIKGYRKENDGVNNESYFRWLYSGVATADNTVSLISPQYLHPLMNCTFRDEAEIGQVNDSKKQNSLFLFKTTNPAMNIQIK